MNPSYRLQNSEIVQGKLLFENGELGLKKALKDGFFFLKIPEGFTLESGDLFAKNFYKDKLGHSPIDTFRGYKVYREDTLDKHEGYYCRDVDQTEQFFLEQRFWQQIYPADLVLLAQKLKSLSIFILKDILIALSIPKEFWDQGTGECTSGQGMYHLTFNHFRPEKKARGLNTHKDSGWITVLRSLDPGLEVFINKKWVSVTPKPGYFIINFGCAFEIFTQKTTLPVSAVIHRVIQQNNNRNGDRFSYALFADSSINPKKCEGLYEYTQEKGLTYKMNFKEFLDNILHATYQEHTVGLY